MNVAMLSAATYAAESMRKESVDASKSMPYSCARNAVTLRNKSITHLNMHRSFCSVSCASVFGEEFINDERTSMSRAANQSGWPYRRSSACSSNVRIPQASSLTARERIRRPR